MGMGEARVVGEDGGASVPPPLKIRAERRDSVGRLAHRIPLNPQKAFDAPATFKSLPIVDERAEITKRIASFKAHQLRLIQDRDKFFRSVMTKIDRTLASDLKDKSL